MYITSQLVIDGSTPLNFNLGEAAPEYTICLMADTGQTASIWFKRGAAYALHVTPDRPIFHTGGAGYKTIIFEDTPQIVCGSPFPTLLVGDERTTLILRGEPGKTYHIFGDIFPVDAEGNGPMLRVESGNWIIQGTTSFSVNDITIDESASLQRLDATGADLDGWCQCPQNCAPYLPFCNFLDPFDGMVDGFGVAEFAGWYRLPGARKGQFHWEAIHFTCHYRPIFLQIGCGIAWERTHMACCQRQEFHHRIASLRARWNGRRTFAEALVVGDRLHHSISRFGGPFGWALRGEVLCGTAIGREARTRCAAAIGNRRFWENSFQMLAAHRGEECQFRVLCRRDFSKHFPNCYGEGSWEHSFRRTGHLEHPIDCFTVTAGMERRRLSAGLHCSIFNHLRAIRAHATYCHCF
jgi:hypothetical protein